MPFQGSVGEEGKKIFITLSLSLSLSHTHTHTHTPSKEILAVQVVIFTRNGCDNCVPEIDHRHELSAQSYVAGRRFVGVVYGSIVHEKPCIEQVNQVRRGQRSQTKADLN